MRPLVALCCLIYASGCVSATSDTYSENVALSTLTASPNQGVADGQQAVDVRIVVRDAFGLAFAEAAVSLSCDDAHLAITAPAMTNAIGSTRSELTTAVAGSYQVRASATLQDGNVYAFPDALAVVFVAPARAAQANDTSLSLSLTSRPLVQTVDALGGVTLLLSVSPSDAVPPGAQVRIAGLDANDTLLAPSMGLNAGGAWQAAYSGRLAHTALTLNFGQHTGIDQYGEQ